MINPRAEAAAVAFNGRIYVMGGYNPVFLTSVECYDPRANCWTECANMIEMHDTAGATVHNGEIFILGGWSGRQCSRTVERYNIQRNEWTKICSLSIARYGLACISIDNKLWAIGGVSANSVSIYDEQNDKWIDKKPIPFEGFCNCFTVPKSLLKSK
ncbi:kelch-like protein 28 [Eurosta solidaginis]|uniref:kelch-like protein 28 n=1 Tax=Eurosta solidaginis TaxID=178769 RepID=UPI003530FEF2